MRSRVVYNGYNPLRSDELLNNCHTDMSYWAFIPLIDLLITRVMEAYFNPLIAGSNGVIPPKLA